MVFGNFSHDGETKTGPLLTRGHVGLEQPLPVFLGQTFSVVDHLNNGSFVLLVGFDKNVSLFLCIIPQSFDRFGSVLYDVD